MIHGFYDVERRRDRFDEFQCVRCLWLMKKTKKVNTCSATRKFLIRRNTWVSFRPKQQWAYIIKAQ